jgi:o-succinylbenzoate synthase
VSTATSCKAAAVKTPIRIAQIELLSLERPLRSSLGKAFKAVLRHRSILVRLQDAEGPAGYGEVSAVDLPAYAADGHDSSWYALTKLLAPRLLSREFEGPIAVAEALEEVKGFSYAKHALEAAAWAVASHKCSRPLSTLWGGVREAIPVGESFGIQDTFEALFEEIDARLAEGFCRIKLKIAPGWDVHPTRAVQERYAGVPVSVDANCRYRAGAAGPWDQLDDVGLEMIEQPFAGDELSPLADLQAKLRTPVCLDESASSPGITRAALRLGAGRIVNIKPARLGGIMASLAVHDICIEHSAPVWCGGMLESGIGRGFNLALSSLPNFTLAADMSPARIFFDEDLVEPTFDIRADGTVGVPSGLGCGFEVQEDRIAKYATTKWSAIG